MFPSRIVLAAALAVSLSPAVVSVASSAEKPMRPGCGWVQEDGKYIFLGTCPHDTSDDSNSTPEVPVPLVT